MPYDPHKKGTIWIPTGDTLHLFVIVNDKCENDCHLLINITSIRNGVPHDPACEVAAGEHPSVNHPSYVKYEMAQTYSVAHLQKMVAGWVYKICDHDVSDELLARILDGAQQSDFIKKRILKYLDEQNL